MKIFNAATVRSGMKMILKVSQPKESLEAKYYLLQENIIWVMKEIHGSKALIYHLSFGGFI
jgi:hypothetical protein